MRIMIVGLGAIGSHVAPLLREHDLVLCDYDIVLEENLPRCPLYGPEDIGTPKAIAASKRIGTGTPLVEPFSSSTSLDGIDLVVEGTDSLDVRAVINDACKRANVPLIVGAASKGRGQVFYSTTPCWRCIVGSKRSEDDCTSGIDLAVLEHVAREQAALVERSRDGLAIIGPEGVIERIRVSKDPRCTACQDRYDGDLPFSLSYCASRDRFQARPSTPLALDLDSMDASVRYPNAIRVELGAGHALIHRHGLIEFVAVDAETAKAFADRIMRR